MQFANSNSSTTFQITKFMYISDLLNSARTPSIWPVPLSSKLHIQLHSRPLLDNWKHFRTCLYKTSHVPASMPPSIKKEWEDKFPALPHSLAQILQQMHTQLSLLHMSSKICWCVTMQIDALHSLECTRWLPKCMLTPLDHTRWHPKFSLHPLPLRAIWSTSSRHTSPSF